ncbi:MAG: PolC-type DNA polymerase III [Johnsonella sp.]|nr:PolC-type DNA polymerase III [Johnsonella sp.]
MMKLFFEVFPGLERKGELFEIFKSVQVERVVSSLRSEQIKIYILSKHLIDKWLIHDMEKLIKDKLFPYRKIMIRIIESYTLSAMYTPENLFAAYRESILYELRQYSIVEYLMLQKADILFTEEGSAEIRIEKNSLNLSKAEDLLRVLDKIFRQRCRVSCRFQIRHKDYLPQKRSEEVFLPREKKEQEQPMKTEFLPVFMEEDGEKSTKGGSDTKKEEKREARSSAFSQKAKKIYKKEFKYAKRSHHPDVIYGKNFEDDFIEIKDIIGDMGEISIRGSILSLEIKFFEKMGNTLFTFALTDRTDSIVAKIFAKPEHVEVLEKELKKGACIKLRGFVGIDKFDGEVIMSFISGIKKSENIFGEKRQDLAPRKRVELHCHTKMSDFDGVSSADEIIGQALSWGMEAIALTDHGNVQCFTEAFRSVGGMKKKGMIPPKIIYGMEGYIVDDLKELVHAPGEYTLDDSFVVFDIETTGFSALHDRIIEIGAVKMKDNEIKERFSCFINPKIPIPYKIQELTGISDEMVMDAPLIEEQLPLFLEFCKDSVLVAHNAVFDTGFIRENARRMGIAHDPAIIDTLAFARLLLPNLGRFKLDNIAKSLGIELKNHHRAVDDAECTAFIWQKFVEMLKERGENRLDKISGLGESDPNMIKKMKYHHIILLAKNHVGRTNLYRLVSHSHIRYFNKKPRIPKSLLAKHREGLILGSACADGELYSAILREESSEDIARIVNFYDYLEIQPIANNAFMIGEERYNIGSEEDLKKINSRIVALGESYQKPVAATCDVHFLNPEDAVYRKIIMHGKGFKDADLQPPLYLRTTEEMLAEFSYLGEDKAYEVVVENTNKIADMIERIDPVRPDKCPPVIENSDEILKTSCYRKAYEQYGENLPKIVSTRLEKELHSIISNGFAVMYIIAKKLVEKSNSDGYLVGSRGSVGSSFAAYTSGITEVNPLPPHYYCECKYVDFDSPEVRQYAGMAGCDMPDRLCPVCQRKLKKDGFDIPFETFLGSEGEEKEPDIDLNFSGEYQLRAHDYTEEIFGKGYTFRAGTVGTLAEKTAYGYVKKYYEEHGQSKRKAEINRLTGGCVGVKRTTGQHPGGIIVLPHGEEIDSFTPVQRPANDMNTKIITTHFDYHAIEHNLLKLDILGHQDPTMIRMLQDLTGIDPVRDIPLDSKETMSLFQNTSALGIEPKDILDCPLGALGVPEFGTDFAMQMLIEAKPKGLSDLVRIAGLAHGTDVWLGNAQTLIKEGKATIRTAICTRDDIMIYLIEQGVEENLAFKIMESVRKGRGLDEKQEEAMRRAGVPDWYILSCKKIKYMFPKAHAAAYVMMAWRIAYCKIFYPLAYYTAYFSIRASGFSYELMCMGRQKLEHNIAEYKRKGDAATAKEADSLRDMRVAQEMYARGFSFAPINIYEAEATRFKITEDSRIMPSLSSIDGLGEIAARQIFAAARKGEFISKDDLMSRAKLGKSTAELLDRLGILGNLPQSNQISLFDMMG